MADQPVLTRQRTARATSERVIQGGLMAAAGLSVLITGAIVFALLRETIGFFGEISFSGFFSGTKWTPLLAGDQASFNIAPLVVGTLYLTGLGLLVAVPVGLLSAIYLSEYAPPRVRRVVKPVLEILAGVPTIVFGYFALTFVTPTLLRGLGLGVEQYNQLAAGLVVGLLITPTIASVAEDAMSSVPYSLREGAFGLGANRMKVALQIVFPAALSGIVAALVLGASRAIGETLIVLLAGGSGQLLNGIVGSPESSAGSMAAFIASVPGGEAAADSIKYKTIFAVGTTLFVITLFLNIISIRLVNKFRQVYD